MTKTRTPVPPAPRKPAFSPMAAPLRKVPYVRVVVKNGWLRDAADSDRECLALVAVRSDGRVFFEVEQMRYEPGERQAIVERFFTGQVSRNDARRMNEIRSLRWRKAQQAYARIQQASQA